MSNDEYRVMIYRMVGIHASLSVFRTWLNHAWN